MSTTVSPLPVSSTEIELLKQLEVPLKHLPALAASFEETFHTLALHSTTQFLPTPIRSLPTGTETGTFLALDLGGTNLRVALVELLGSTTGSPSGDRIKIPTQGAWSIPEALKSSDAESLFTWVASKMLEVLREAGTAEMVVETGITFSFPMEQRSHTTALMMPMGKGFTFTHTNDLAALLSGAYTESRTPSDPTLEIVAITNDSVATLLCASYAAAGIGKTAAGVIAGTGTNATCMCPLSKLHPSKLPTEGIIGIGSMLLNTEWSINGTVPPLEPYMTTWDRALDASNEKPGFQPFEEMVGGRYIGELVRLAVLDVVESSRKLPAGMYIEYGVDTKLCGDVEAMVSDAEVLALLEEYFSEGKEDSGEGEWDLQTAGSFKRVSCAVSTRAAALVAAATVGVLGVNGELGVDDGEDVVVGYTGTIFERYPGFREKCGGFMVDIVRERRGVDGIDGSSENKGGGSVRLVEAKDGGVVGAAVLAAMVKWGRT